MSRYPQGLGAKGSLRWIQQLVNHHPDVLAKAIGLSSIEWCSPREADEYAEYRDQACIDLLGIRLPHRRLTDFWPERGPQWDALGRAATGESVLVEAKAHISEIFSSPTQAGDRSAALIRSSLAEAAAGLGAAPGLDWSQRFYQYCNRLAHGWFLSEVNAVPVRLAFVHFIGDSDVGGPSTRREWEAALSVLHEAIGLCHGLPEFAVEAFIDVRPTIPIAV